MLHKYILKRFGALAIILFGLSALTFVLTAVLPSDPVTQLIASMGQSSDPELIASLSAEYGLDKPVFEQYVDWISGVAVGDFGESVSYGQPVSEVLLRKLPNTILLAFSSFILMIVIALPLGVLSAVYHNKRADNIIKFLSFVGIALPSFWVGLLLIDFFAVDLHLLPVGGSDSFLHLIMPCVTLAIGMASVYIRRIRVAMLEQMNELYITGALSRGVKYNKIIVKHVLPNSLLSIVTMLGMSLGDLLGGTMIVEAVFGWNGIGKTAVDAITARDYGLIQGYVLWMGVIYVVINLVVDISYTYLDPRIRLKRKEAKDV